MVLLLSMLSRSGRLRKLRVLLLIAIVTTTAACSEREDQSVALTYVQAFMQDPMALARGEALFMGSCAGYCHGLDSEESEASFLFDCEWDHGNGDDEIFEVITSGIPDTLMVGFGDNFPGGDEDKWRIIAFLRSNQQSCD